MDRLQDAERENAPNDARDLECQLLCRIEAVDAVGDSSLKRIRKCEILKVQEARVDSAFLILDHQNSRIAQGIREFLRKKRMPFRFFANQATEHGGYRFDTQALTHQGFHIIELHGLELKQTCARRIEDLFELDGNRVNQWTGIQC